MPTIAFDFDGVLHSYTSGWTGPFPYDPPVPGAQEAVRAFIREGWKVVVFTCRADTPAGKDATEAWLMKWDFPWARMTVTDTKPRAEVYVDDRGYRFSGDFSEIIKWATTLKGPRTWNEKEE